jgi:hypothetical protein
MQLMIDNGAWIFSGLLFFVAVWCIAFFARNTVAKSEKNMSGDINPKTNGTIAIQKNSSPESRK